MSEDFSFDKRVAGIYDLQRVHPADVSPQIGRTIADYVGQGAHMLEIGIGTGRIALPVVKAGCQVVGIDLSAQMLEYVASQEGNDDTQPLYALQSDMHHLPFPDNSFDAVMAIHVLHLAKDWQVVMKEIARVLKPDGLFIQGKDWIDPASVVGQLRDTLRMRVVAMAPHMMPPAAQVSKADLIKQLGGRETEEKVAAEWVLQVSANDRLRDVENRMDAESWILPDDLFDAVLNQLREYAAETWEDLDAKQPVTRRFVLEVTRGNW